MADPLLQADGEAHAEVRAAVLRIDDGARTRAEALLAAEVPIAFEYNGVAHAVMLATPSDLHDFAIGFSLSEAIALPAQCYAVEAHESEAGITVAIEIAGAAFEQLKSRRRTLAGRTGCGICGTESLDQVLRPLPDLSAVPLHVAPAALAAAYAGLNAVQPLQRATGAAHGAVWCATDGQIVYAREDIGRHNALDKLIGALARAKVDTAQGFAVVTSRASVEMVQKAATAGIALLAAVSAPTALGVRLAQQHGQTLVGFARGAQFSVYSHADRIRA